MGDDKPLDATCVFCEQRLAEDVCQMCKEPACDICAPYLTDEGVICVECYEANEASG